LLLVLVKTQESEWNFSRLIGSFDPTVFDVLRALTYSEEGWLVDKGKMLNTIKIPGSASLICLGASRCPFLWDSEQLTNQQRHLTTDGFNHSTTNHEIQLT